MLLHNNITYLNACRHMHGKKVARCLQDRFDAAAAHSLNRPGSFNPMGGQRHSFNNPTWSPEPSSVLPSPCSSFKAQSDAYGEPSQSIWETLQGPWDPSPSWWFSPLESHLEQGKAAPQLAGATSYNTEAESIEPHSLPGPGLHPALWGPPCLEASSASGNPAASGPAMAIWGGQQLQPQEQLSPHPAGAIGLSNSNPVVGCPVAGALRGRPNPDPSTTYDPFQIRSTGPQPEIPGGTCDVYESLSATVKDGEDRLAGAHASAANPSSCISSGSGSYRSARSSANLGTMLASACFPSRQQVSHHRPVMTSAHIDNPSQRPAALSPPEESISPAALRNDRELPSIDGHGHGQLQRAAYTTCWSGKSGIMPRDLAAQPGWSNTSSQRSEGQASQQASSDPSQASASTSFSVQNHVKPSTSPDTRQLAGGVDAKAGSPSAASTPQANACSEDPCVSLLEVLRHHGGPLPEALAWAAVEEAAGTLQKLHDADLVHGAVSLETISLDGSVKAR